MREKLRKKKRKRRRMRKREKEKLDKERWERKENERINDLLAESTGIVERSVECWTRVRRPGLYCYLCPNSKILSPDLSVLI